MTQMKYYTEHYYLQVIKLSSLTQRIIYFMQNRTKIYENITPENQNHGFLVQ
jgi:hypothetical protein